MRVLVVEDDESIASFLQVGLSEDGLSVDVASDGKEGYYLATTNSYDIMIFDVMIPFIDGIELCAEVRKQKISTPIIFLTAKDDLDSLVNALDGGGDDYMTKPFKLKELQARIRVALRKDKNKQTILTHHDIEYNPSSHLVKKSGVEIKLTQKEKAILELFLRNIGVMLSEATIIEHVWDQESITQSNIVNVYIYRLRKKIDNDGEKRLIHNLRHSGYIMQ